MASTRRGPATSRPVRRVRAGRRLLAVYRDVPARPRLAVLALLTVLTVSVGYARTGSWTVAAATGAVTVTAGLVVNAAVQHPSALATVAVIAAVSLLGARFGAIYTVSAAGSLHAAADGVVMFVLLAGVTALIAHRTSRGRPWLTVAAAMTAVMFVGPWLLLLAPWAGFGVAVAVAAAVLALRAGGWQRMTRAAHAARNRLRRNRPNPASPGGSATQSFPAGRTARALRGLPDGYHVLDSVTVGTDATTGEPIVADHVVIGPSGVHVLTSYTARGTLTEDPAEGLHDRGHPLTPTLRTLADVAASTADAAHRNRDLIVPVLVVTGAPIPHGHLRVGLYRDDGDDVNDAPLAVIEIVPAQRLRRHLMTAPHRMSPSAVAAAARRLANASPETRSSAAAGTSPGPRPPRGHRTVTVTAPAPLLRTTDHPNPPARGTRVALLTEDGVRTGLIVRSEAYPDVDGVLTVDVAPPGADTYFPFPVASTRPE